MESEHMESVRELGRIEAHLENLRRRAIEDPELREAVRLKAWLRVSPQRLSMEDGQIVSPSGWPEGLDSDLEVEALVDERLDEREQLRRKAARLGYRLEPEEQW